MPCTRAWVWPVAWLGLTLSALGPVDALAAQPPKGKSPAILVLMHSAASGQPKSDPRMNHFAMPDPKLRARLKKLGFQVAVSP